MRGRVEVARLPDFLRQITLGPPELATVDFIALLSPMLGSTMRYSDLKTSQRIVSESLAAVEPCDREVLVRSLYKITHKLNSRLAASMGSQTASERRFAHTAMQESPWTGMNQDWLHGVMQILLLDRVLYAITGTPMVASYSGSSSSGKQIPEEFEKLFSSLDSWQEVMDHFCQLWESAYDSANGEVLFPRVTTTDHEQQGGVQSAVSGNEELSGDDRLREMHTHIQSSSGCEDGILRQLVRGVKSSWQSVKVNTVFNNFCFAAMGLRALMLRGNLYSLEFDDLWWRFQKEEKLGDLLRQECRDVERLIPINEDYSILRPLYIMVGISPIVLLSGTSVTSSGHVRYPLHGIVRASSVGRAAPDEQRLQLEHCLLYLVVEMALKGPSVFESSVAKVIAHWGSIRETSNLESPPRALVEVIPEGDSSDVSTRRLVIDRTRRAENKDLNDRVKRDSITRQLRKILNATGDVKLGRAIIVSRLAFVVCSCDSEECMGEICIVQRERDGPLTELEVETITAGLKDEQGRCDRHEPQKLLIMTRRSSDGIPTGPGDMAGYELEETTITNLPDQTREMSPPSALVTADVTEKSITKEFLGRNTGYGADEPLVSKSSQPRRSDSPKRTLGKRCRTDYEAEPRHGRAKLREKVGVGGKAVASGFGTAQSCEEKIERIRDTFGNAIKLGHAWSGTQVLRFCGVVNADRVLKPYIPIGTETIGWKTSSFAIPSFDPQGTLAKVLSCLVMGSPATSKYETTEVYTRMQWGQLDDSQRREKFRSKNILVKSGYTGTTERACFSKTSELSKIVDTWAQLQARDCTETPNSAVGKNRPKFGPFRMVRSSIREFLHNVKEFRKKGSELGWNISFDAVEPDDFETMPIMETNYRVLNFSDIPVADDVFQVPLDDFSQYLVRNSFRLSKEEVGTFSTGCSPKDAGKRWMLVSAMSAWTDWHIGPGGLGTAILMADGEELWVINSDPKLLPGAFTEDTFQRIKSDLILLEKGDMLFMRPATNHLVVTLKDSIVLGGHFYSYEQMKYTLRGLLLGHYLGRNMTNTDHVKAPVLLMKAVCSLASRYAESNREDSEEGLSVEDEVLAFLLVIVAHLDQLLPDLSEEVDTIPWQETDLFVHDFRLAGSAVREVIQHQLPDFTNHLDSAERFMDEECSAYELRLLKEEPDIDHSAKVVRVVCLCDRHSSSRGGKFIRWVPFADSSRHT